MEIEINVQQAFEAALDQIREMTKQGIYKDQVIETLQKRIAVQEDLLTMRAAPPDTQ